MPNFKSIPNNPKNERGLLYKRVSPTRIKTTLKEITPENYLDTILALAERDWESIRKKNTLKNREKCCESMLGLGFASILVYDKVKELDNSGQ